MNPQSKWRAPRIDSNASRSSPRKNCKGEVIEYSFFHWSFYGCSFDSITHVTQEVLFKLWLTVNTCIQFCKVTMDLSFGNVKNGPGRRKSARRAREASKKQFQLQMKASVWWGPSWVLVLFSSLNANAAERWIEFSQFNWARGCDFNTQTDTICKRMRKMRMKMKMRMEVEGRRMHSRGEGDRVDLHLLSETSLTPVPFASIVWERE